MCGWLPWLQCYILYRTRDQLPVSAQQWPPPTEHQSCRRHNIDMSFPHHFLLPANAASTLSQAKADTDPKIVGKNLFLARLAWPCQVISYCTRVFRSVPKLTWNVRQTILVGACCPWILKYQEPYQKICICLSRFISSPGYFRYPIKSPIKALPLIAGVLN